MKEQEKYGEMLLEMIKKTKNDKIQTSEQLIQELIHELTHSNEFLLKKEIKTSHAIES